MKYRWSIICPILLATVGVQAQRSAGPVLPQTPDPTILKSKSVNGPPDRMLGTDKTAWGYKGHYFINLKAAGDLPDFTGWFKGDSTYFQLHASDPDIDRDPSDTSFFANQWQHYLDGSLSFYLTSPHDLDSALMLSDSVTVKRIGTNPYAVKWWLDTLTAQLARGDSNSAKESASYLGHYVADAHQPLHATTNYNGQLTGNSGIHSRYESTMLNGTFGDSITYVPEVPHYIASPVDTEFSILYYAFGFTDSIMAADNFAKSLSGGSYTTVYYDALWHQTRYFTQDLWQRAATHVASFWYTAWLNAHPQQVTVQSRWNLISLPRKVPSGMKNVVFPASVSDAYSFVPGSGYHVENTLARGCGYWLKFNSATTVSVIGEPLALDTFAVAAGWNMIGSISDSVSTTSVSSIPPNLVTSDFYEYNNGYLTSNVILPGKGYWVRVNQAGSLILSSTPSASPSNRIKIVPTAEAPPAPPEGGTESNPLLPGEFSLAQNYPNPFNPISTITYELPVDSKVVLKIYNVLGQVVATLVNTNENAGYKSASWNAGNVASGIYFYRLEAVAKDDASKSFTQVKKMVLMK